MANYSYPNRVGRIGRTPAPITTFVKVDDRRSDQGPAVGRAEISEEHVAMPVSVTDGVVTKIETIERVYTTSATAYTDGFTTNGEVIENYATTEGVQGSNRSALPRGLFPRQTLNNSKANSGTNEDVNAGATGSSKPIGGGNKDVGPNQLSKPGGGITKDAAPNRLSTPSGGGGADTGTNSWSRPIDGVTEDIGPNGRRGLIGGTTNSVPTNESRPTDVINSTAGTSNLNRPSAGTNNSGSGAWKPIGGTNDTGSDGRNQSSGGGPGAGGGPDTSTNNWSRPIDGSTDNIGPSGRKGLTGGTTNGIPTNESRPTDVKNSTVTSTQNRPSAGANNSSYGTWSWINPTAGTNNTGNDGRSWPSGGGGGAGGTDTGANSWNRPIDGATNDIGPNRRRVLIGGTTLINESRPADGANSTGTIPWRGPSAGANYIGTRPIVGANNTDAGAWSKPIVGTSITGKDGRSGQPGGTNDTGDDWRSRPSVMTIPQQKIDGSLDKNVPPFNPPSRITPTSRPKYDISTPSPGAVVLPRATSRPNRIGRTSPRKYDISSVVHAKDSRPKRMGRASPPKYDISSVVPAKEPPSGGGGGTDASTNHWNRPIDGTAIANDIGPNGMKGLIGGTAYGIPNNESRPSIGTIPWRGSSVGANNISARPVVGANNSSTGAWGNPIVGTNYGCNERSGLTSGTNYIGADWTSRPRVMIADEYRPNRPAWGQPPTSDIPTRRPTNYPSVAVETVKLEPSKAPQTQAALGWRGQFSPTTEPKTIDSNEAAAKYNRIGFTAPRPRRKKSHRQS